MLRPRTEATKEVLLSRKGSLYRWTLLNLLISLPPSYCQCARQTVQLIIHIPHSITPSDVHPRDTAPCALFQARCTHQRFLSWEINFLFSSKTSHSEDFFLFCHCCFVMFSPGGKKCQSRRCTTVSPSVNCVQEQTWFCPPLLNLENGNVPFIPLGLYRSFLWIFLPLSSLRYQKKGHDGGFLGILVIKLHFLCLLFCHPIYFVHFLK